MPTLQEFFDELHLVNTNLQQLHNDVLADTAATNAVKASVDQTNALLTVGFTTISRGLQTLANLQVQTHGFLAHKVQQQDTIICILEKVSRNTCEQLNQAALQTPLQSAIRDAADELRQLYESAHANAAVDFHRLRKIKAELAACCPPEEPPPACEYEPCPRPDRRPEEPVRVEVLQFEPEI